MSRIVFIGSIASAAAMLALTGCGPRTAVPILRDDAQAIRAAWEAASAALCTGDRERYRRLWGEGPEVELLHPDGPERIVGSTAILRYYDRLFDAGLRCSYATTRFDVQIAPAGDFAWVSAEGVVTFAGPPMAHQRTWYTLVFARQSGSWRLAHAQAAAVRAPRDSDTMRP